MRFLTPDEWQAWCITRSVPVEEGNWPSPEFYGQDDGYHVVELPYPADSGAKVAMARRLMTLVQSKAETMILVDEWDVWPSSGHLPLMSRFREALGEYRPLIEAPGHLVPRSHVEDGISIVAMALLFVWDCYGISANGSHAFFISHDEYCYLASRDKGQAEQVRSEWAG
jgi:hypothetical protein